MSNHGDVGGDGARLNLLGITRLVYDFLDQRAKGPDGDDGGGGWAGDSDSGLWAKAKGIVQHQYALTPLSWACSLSEHSIQGRAISVDDFAWLWHFPDVKHAPLSRLVGYGWFCGRRYDLNASTLDPRWESEGLIDIVCAQVDLKGYSGVGRILDVGTGSGCLLVELLQRYPSACGVGLDISADALLMAGKNAHRYGVAERVRWMVGDCAQVLKDLGGDAFDVIVSNPPYVPTGYVAPKNVALWDPDAALYAGVDGLDCYRSWIGLMVQRLAPFGILVLEMGYDQGDAVFHLCQHAGLSQIHILPDHDGKDRYVWGRL